MKQIWFNFKLKIIKQYYKFLIHLILKLRKYKLYKIVVGSINLDGMEYKNNFILKINYTDKGTVIVLYMSPSGGFGIKVVNAEDFSMGLVNLPDVTLGKKATDSINSPSFNKAATIHKIGILEFNDPDWEKNNEN